jgi:hypothetical protein
MEPPPPAGGVAVAGGSATARDGRKGAARAIHVDPAALIRGFAPTAAQPLPAAANVPAERLRRAKVLAAAGRAEVAAALDPF